MRVLLVRHGEAIDPHLADHDGSRWLTPRGRATVNGVARVIAERGVRFDRIFTSPLVRAVQTAELLAAATSSSTITVEPALAGGTPGRVVSALDELTDRDVAAFVGHEPLIRAVAARLMDEPSFPAFHTSSAFMIETTPQPQLLFLVDPRTLNVATSLTGYTP